MKNDLVNNNIIKQIITIFFIETSSSAAFAVLFSSLSLYLTQYQHYSGYSATFITGLFLFLNYFLPFVGGFLANNFISSKNFFFLGTLMSVIGCAFLASGKNSHLGLSLFLMSSLVTNVCLKMFTTNLFAAEQTQQRRAAFMWNYIGMNAGFLIGFFISGYSLTKNSSANLFIFIGVLLAVSALLTLCFIGEAKKYKNSTLNQIIVTTLVLTLLVAFLSALFNFAIFFKKYMMLSVILGVFFYLYYIFQKIEKKDRANFIKLIGYSFLAILFWSLYMLTPTAFMQLIDKNVERNIFGINLAPQWFLNADSIVILAIAPILAYLMSKAKSVFNQKFHNINYFFLAFSACALSFLILANGFHHVSSLKIPIWNMLGCLVFLAIGETFISPIGNSLIGELIPESLQAMMMGWWSMNTGIGILCATGLSNTLLLPYIKANSLTSYHFFKLEQNITTIFYTIFLLLMSFLIYNQVIKKLLIPGKIYKKLEPKI